MNSVKPVRFGPTPWIAAPATRPNWRDFLQLCKPRVVLLMLLCTVVGMCLATSTTPGIYLLLTTLTGVALMAGSAAAVNHVADAEIDSAMARTRSRPLPTGRVNSRQGIVFAAVSGSLGFCLLYFTVNPLTAWLNLASWVGYGLVYTLVLKRATSQNIVIGGLFGAAPPLFGWTAVTNSIELGGVWLVWIIFLWTPPHFWALALERKEEYASAGIPMLPVTHGERVTRIHIFVYTVLLVGSTLAPWFTADFGLIYLSGAVLLGARFLYLAFALLANRDPKVPMVTFRYSITYLMLLFLCLMTDHYLWQQLAA